RRLVQASLVARGCILRAPGHRRSSRAESARNSQRHGPDRPVSPWCEPLLSQALHLRVFRSTCIVRRGLADGARGNFDIGGHVSAARARGQPRQRRALDSRRRRKKQMTASQPTFELSQYLAPMRRYRAHVITFVVAAPLSSVVMTYVVSERYRATSTVLYQPNASVSFRPKVRDAFGFPMPLVPLESIGNTIDEVAHSDALLTETVRA